MGLIPIVFQPLKHILAVFVRAAKFQAKNWSLKQIVNSFLEAAFTKKTHLKASGLQKTCTQLGGGIGFHHDVAGRLEEVNMISSKDLAGSPKKLEMPPLPPKKNIIQPQMRVGWNNHVAYLSFVLKLPHFHTTHHLFQAHPQGQLPKRNMKGNWKYSLGSFKRLYLGICCVSREYIYLLPENQKRNPI